MASVELVKVERVLVTVGVAGVGSFGGWFHAVRGGANSGGRGVAVVGVVGGGWRAVQFGALYVRRGVTCGCLIVGKCWAVPSGTHVGCRGVAVVGVVGGGLFVVRFGAYWGRCGVACAEECGYFPLEDVVHDVGRWSAWLG